jgi:hypothetical protein
MSQQAARLVFGVVKWNESEPCPDEKLRQLDEDEEKWDAILLSPVTRGIKGFHDELLKEKAGPSNKQLPRNLKRVR